MRVGVDSGQVDVTFDAAVREDHELRQETLSALARMGYDLRQGTEH